MSRPILHWQATDGWLTRLYGVSPMCRTSAENRGSVRMPAKAGLTTRKFIEGERSRSALWSQSHVLGSRRPA